MYSRFITPPKGKSFFLFGPRGTGKTTWVKSAFPKAVYIDLLEAELFNDLTANPQRLSNFIPPDFKDWVIIDEIQRIPDLLHEVHRLIETKRYRFILTGSSPRKLKRKGPNLLAGRALTLSMHPLSVAELGDDFRLEHSLRYGQLPSVYTEADPQKYLEAYVKNLSGGRNPSGRDHKKSVSICSISGSGKLFSGVGVEHFFCGTGMSCREKGR